MMLCDSSNVVGLPTVVVDVKIYKICTSGKYFQIQFYKKLYLLLHILVIINKISVLICTPHCAQPNSSQQQSINIRIYSTQNRYRWRFRHRTRTEPSAFQTVCKVINCLLY